MILYFSATGNGKYIAEQIAAENNHPVWKLEECEMCLGCLHRCPRFAISYGNAKTSRHGQYRNPYTQI